MGSTGSCASTEDEEAPIRGRLVGRSRVLSNIGGRPAIRGARSICGHQCAWRGLLTVALKAESVAKSQQFGIIPIAGKVWSSAPQFCGARHASTGYTIAGDAEGRVTGRSLLGAPVGHRGEPKTALPASKS